MIVEMFDGRHVRAEMISVLGAINENNGEPFFDVWFPSGQRLRFCRPGITDDERQETSKKVLEEMAGKREEYSGNLEYKLAIRDEFRKVVFSIIEVRDGEFRRSYGDLLQSMKEAPLQKDSQ